MREWPRATAAATVTTTVPAWKNSWDEWSLERSGPWTLGDFLENVEKFCETMVASIRVIILHISFFRIAFPVSFLSLFETKLCLETKKNSRPVDREVWKHSSAADGDLSSQHVSGSASTRVVSCYISYYHGRLTHVFFTDQMIFYSISLQRSEVTQLLGAFLRPKRLECVMYRQLQLSYFSDSSSVYVCVCV